jgi:hypothetical protein
VDAFTTALDVLLRSGWRGALVALALVAAYALARAYGLDAWAFVRVVFAPRGPQDPADEGGQQPAGSVPVDSNGTPVATRPEGDLGQGGEG